MPGFVNSEKMLERALKVIPNGTQTFSKSRTQYPVGFSPLYARFAKGCKITDEDGNTFLDTVSGLGSILLGYHDWDVDEAVCKQIQDGSIFSLPHRLEIEVSEMLCGIIPSAEMVRIGKNGSDVTSGAVRLARYYTKKDHVVCCGYHGWQDWYVGITARNGGIPDCIKQLTHKFEYNNIESLNAIFKEYPGQIACVIMEPIIDEWPLDDFLHKVSDLTRENGALFILDEMITGFRFKNFSVQKELAITPDISCFGKAMGNGYPISALVGKSEIMEKLSELHFSFTFGGDCIGLAAAKATLKKLNPCSEMNWHGHLLQKVLTPTCKKVGIKLLGYPERLIFKFEDEKNKWKLFQELLNYGILCIGFINLTYAFEAQEIERLIDVFTDIIPNLDKIQLKFKPIDPLFKIR